MGSILFLYKYYTITNNSTYRKFAETLLCEIIEEIWNSDKALELAKISIESIKDDSACKKCSIYESCSSFPNKCYADTIKAYGDKNWDYPDPRCIHAPNFINPLTYNQ